MRYFLLVAALVAAAFGYTLYWNRLAASYSNGTRDWIVAREKQGYTVSTGGYRVTGFPGQIVLTIDQPKIGRPGDPLAWEVQADRLILYAQPWNFSHFILDFGKHATVAWTRDGTRRTAAIAATDAKMSFLLDGHGALGRFDSELRDATVTGAGLAAPIQAASFELHGRSDPEPGPHRPKGSVDLAVYASKLTLPPDPALALGNEITTLNALLTVPPPLPTAMPSIAAWRDAGGIVQLTALTLHWGPLDLRGNGTLTLDKEMRPLAALSTEIRGFGPSLDALSANGRMAPGDANLAKTALGLLAKTDKQGERVLKVPLTAQDGRLFVGPVALFHLAPLPLPPTLRFAGQNPAG